MWSRVESQSEPPIRIAAFASEADLSLAIDHPVPGHLFNGGIVAQSRHGITHHACAAPANDAGDLPVSDNLSRRYLPDQSINPFI